jgi:ribonucleotide reductase alpha subunit
MSSKTSQPLDAAVPPELHLSANALTVLEDRYLMRGDDGQVAETPAEMFRRVAKAVATAEREWGATTEQCERLEGNVLPSHGRASLSTEFPHADERRETTGHAFRVLCPAARRLHR